MNSPESSNRIFPAEWSPHSATWFTWPSNVDTWSEAVEAVRRDLANAFLLIAQGECVLVNVATASEAEQVRDLTGGHPNIRLLKLPSNDCWCRDHGPTFVMENGRPHGVLWNYNAWGGKYPPYRLDAKLGRHMCSRIGLDSDHALIVAEGGALESNGQDILLTSASCILNSNRNPALDKKDAETELRRQLGLRHIGWIEGHLEGDDTDGHIDNLARFTSDSSLVIGESVDTLENTMELVRLEQVSGRSLKVEALPDPGPIEQEGIPLPASHLNFYIANSCVLVPTFGGSSDDAAIQILSRHFPDHDVVGLDCRSIIRGLGAIHCLSQQVPFYEGFVAPESDF